MNYKVLILNKLKEEFQKDLRKWNAENYRGFSNNKIFIT